MLYLVQTWSLQAPPSLAAIPRLNDQHNRLREKGLRVIGVNASDPDKNAVEAFVREKGANMAFSVVSTGPQSAFTRQWLEPTGMMRPPAAFIIRDGVLQLVSGDGGFDDTMIEAMLEGPDGVRKAADGLKERAARRAELSRLSKAFNEAAEKGDVPAMEIGLAAIQGLAPNFPPVKAFELEVAFAKKDWESAGKLVKDPGRAQFSIHRAATYAASGHDLPDNLLAEITARYAATMADGERGGPLEYVTLSRLHFRCGDKDAATSAAKLALQKVSEPHFLALGVPVPPFAAFATEVQAGRMPTIEEFDDWMREDMAKRRGIVPAPKPPGGN